MISEKMTEFTQRDFWQNPDTLLALMKIEPAEHIAEIGAGEGYFSVKLAEQVGPDGKLIALDIDDNQLNVLRLIKRYSELEQLEIIKNQASQLDLEKASLDKVVMVNSYHELINYESILKQCLNALKPGGNIFIIDKCDGKLDNDKAARKKLFKKKNIRLSMVAEDLKNAGFKVNLELDQYTKQNGKVNWFMVAASKE